ncbi:DUF6236 family protein [Pseudomonas sp. YQ_13]|uniref:DUF6236 family protein n=1 Tax=Pseudomonas sp. YQ_13 TaxID=3367235 RepID=UPI00370A1491
MDAQQKDGAAARADHRGLVIQTPITLTPYSCTTGEGLDPQELRFALLFWDKILWPTGNFDFGTTNDTDFLVGAGVIERPEFRRSGSLEEWILGAHFGIYQKMEELEPGAWSMSFGENSLFLQGFPLDFGQGAQVELTRAIPIPQRDTPLEDILRFKERRKDELINFRTHIEGLSEAIATSLAPTEEFLKCVKEVGDACSDLQKVGRDFQFPMHLSTFRPSLNLRPRLVGKVMGAWSTGLPMGLEIATLSAAATGIHEAVRIKTDFRLRSFRAPVSPYRYAYSLNKELI